jgi:predicted acetyltransferase
VRLAGYTVDVTTPRDDLQLRPATPDDFDGVWGALERAFGEDFNVDNSGTLRAVFEPERNLVFTDGDQVVANAGAYTRELTVPGAVVPAAHVTLVGVRPTHRRQGLLTRLMHRQLRDVREAGVEPIAVLWASEGRIYQRFGYGPAAFRYSFEVNRQEAVFLPRIAFGAGRLREAEPADVRKEIADVYERVRAVRPGLSSRNEQWWDHVLLDPKDHRDGATARRALLYEGADGVEGYALWRTKMDWGHTGPNGRVEVREMMAATPGAYAALLRFVFSVDLTREVRFWTAPLDEPLMYMLDEPRVLAARQGESLWVRVADVPAALAARRYCAPVDAVLEVTDTLLPDNAGRWRLRADASGVTCVPADGPADVALDVADLGTAYLGSVSLIALAGAGRVRELRPGALTALSTAFGWPLQPMVSEIF